MSELRLAVVRAVRIRHDGTSDGSEILELRGRLGPAGKPETRQWRLRHVRGAQVVRESDLARISNG